MNTPNTHTQLPENCIVVDREWLEWYLQDEKGLLNYITNNSYPLTPILEEAWNESIDASLVHFDIANREVSKQSFLSQPITLKKK